MSNLRYSELMDMVNEEKCEELDEVSVVVDYLISDTMIDDDDIIANDNHENSPRKKLRNIARLFLNDDFTFFGNSDSFHNLAVDYARMRMYSSSCIIIERGLKALHSSVDLLSDKIQYQANCGQLSKAHEAYLKLCEIDKSVWNWRAFAFSIDYFIEKKSEISSVELFSLRNEVFRLSNEFIEYAKKNNKYLDIAYSKYAKLIVEFGANENEKEIEVLEQGLKSAKKAPRCGVRLAILYFENGKYDECLKIIDRSIPTGFDIQPDVDSSYIFLLRALSKTSKLFADNPNNKYNGMENEIRNIFRDFNTVLSFSNLSRIYRKAAESAIAVLEEQSGIINDNSALSTEFI